MADLAVKEHAEQVNKDYIPTVIKFNNKEAVDNQSEAMKMNGYMIMQVGGFKFFFTAICMLLEETHSTKLKDS